MIDRMTSTPLIQQPRMHDWRIDPAQYARQEQRRGRRHAYEHLDATRTALVVIDMVPFFLADDDLSYGRGIVPNIALLAKSLRDAGGVVAWILPAVSDEVSDWSKEFFGADIAEMFNRSGGSGPLELRIWHEFDVNSNDLIVEKSAASAFFPGRCLLPELLEARSIDTVLITGVVTNVCCESSARDASTLGYRVIMVADANATVDDAMHNATLQTIYRTFGDVRPTAEVLELISTRTAADDE